jgi:hypothetical protein
MTRELDIDRILNGFLAEGTNELADRVLDAALNDIDSTKQRRAWWPPRRFPDMNSFARYAIAAAAVIAVVIVGYSFLPGNSPGAGPTPTPTPIVSPSPSPTPEPTLQVLGNGPLNAGTVIVEARALGSMTATLEVPAGWEGFDGSCLLPSSQPNGQEMGICFLEVAGLYSDPCHGTSAGPDVPVGPGVDDLANALVAQDDYEASTPTEVTLAGYSGKVVDLHLPTDVATCDQGAFFPWAGTIYAQGPDNLWRVWILDVEGTRVVLMSNWFEATSAGDQAALQAVVDSLQITP